MARLPPDADRMLADLLRDNQVVNAAIFEEASSQASSSNEGIVTALLSSGATDEERIAAAIADAFGFSVAHISQDQISNRPVQDKVSINFITRNRVLPFHEDGDTLHVAVTDPGSLQYVNELRMMTGKNIETFVAPLSVLDAVESATTEKKPTPSPTESSPATPPKTESVQKPPAQKPIARTIKPSASGSDVIDCVEGILNTAISLGVSDIHIETFRDRSRVRYRMDGVLKEMDEFSEFLHFNYSSVSTRLKILASLDISERRLPQDGAIVNSIGDKTVDIRVSVLPTVHGERIVMRILDPDSANFTLDELGFDDATLKRLRKAIHSPQGMILVTGPTGSGKSTTLYGVLKELNQSDINILTAEDPVEYDLSGVGQVHVRDDIGLTFASALRSFLRQDPEVIMVGEIRDKETGDIAIKASLTGHLVLSTLHTNDAPSTITRLINMGIPSYLITSSLSLVIAQRLARKNCPECQADDKDVTQEELLGIGFTEDELKTLTCTKSTGCDHCMNTGVKGRRAIHEVLTVTQPIRHIILEEGSDNDIREAAEKENFQTMQVTGRRLIQEGIITVDEYKRILVLD